MPACVIAVKCVYKDIFGGQHHCQVCTRVVRSLYFPHYNAIGNKFDGENLWGTSAYCAAGVTGVDKPCTAGELCTRESSTDATQSTKDIVNINSIWSASPGRVQLASRKAQASTREGVFILLSD